MTQTKYNLLLADDDDDDRIFFKEVLEDVSAEVTLTTVKNGVELMNKLIANSGSLPDLLFLDLNMPRKSGFECLEEIKSNQKLKSLPVIIYSTSLNTDVVNLLYDKGAQYYIRKPGNYSSLKKVISEALKIALQPYSIQPSRDKFILYS